MVRSQRHIAYLLVVALLASLAGPGIPIALAAESEAQTATTEPLTVQDTVAAEALDPEPAAEPVVPEPAAAAIEATVCVWDDSEEVAFDVDPVVGVRGPTTRRVTVTVECTQAYALQVRTDGDFTVVSAPPSSSVGKKLPPSVARISQEGTDDWRELSSVPTTLFEQTDISHEHTYSLLFDLYPTQACAWDVIAGGYEARVLFSVAALDVPAAPDAKLPADEDPVPAAAEATSESATLPSEPTTDASDPATEPASVVTTPPPLPVFQLQGTVTATLTSDPETSTDLQFWLAGAELAPASTLLAFGDLVGYRLMLTLDGAVVGELAPVIVPPPVLDPTAALDTSTMVEAVPVISSYVCNWDTTGVIAGDHVLGVLAKTSEEDPGIMCWSAGINVVLPPPQLPGDVPASDDAPAAIEGSMAPVPNPVPDSGSELDAADSGGAAG